MKRGHRDNHPNAFWSVFDCKLEATAEPLPNNVAPEPKSPPPSILHSAMSNHILAKLSQICTAVGANQQSSSAFMQLQVLVSCLHCYQMKLPYTNQINQQLPIFQVIGSYWLLSNCIKSMYATAEISEPHRTRAKQGAGSCK